MMNRPPIMAKMIKKHPANGFEDRGSRVRNRPSTSTGVRSLARTSIVDRPRPRLSIMLAVNTWLSAARGDRRTLNPKVQGSIPCASINMLCLRSPHELYVVVGLPQCVIFAAFDSFV
jgi:hypothetical protein